MTEFSDDPEEALKQARKELEKLVHEEALLEEGAPEAKKRVKNFKKDLKAMEKEVKKGAKILFEAWEKKKSN